MSKEAKPRAVLLVVLLALLCLVANGQTPAAPSSAQLPSNNQPNPDLSPLSLDQALRLAAAQASTYQSAILNERIAAEDIKQAQAAFLPKVSAPLGYIYTSPAIGQPPGEPRLPSFIASDAISQYQAFVSVSGDFDIAGKLRATLAKNRSLLAAAHAGTEVARRALSQAVIETYYGLALATAQRQAAEANLSAAEEFERLTSLLLSGGEVAPVDLTRAQLQALSRRDELERARITEQVVAGSVRVLIGYDFARPLTTTELALALPTDSEFRRFKAADLFRRPEFIQLEQQLSAARQEITSSRRSFAIPLLFDQRRL
jgi:outer membrane protein TolC